MAVQLLLCADSVLSLAPKIYTKRMPEIDLLTVTFPRRIAVVNRGEAAVRLIRAVRELNAEYGCGIKPSRCIPTPSAAPCSYAKPTKP